MNRAADRTKACLNRREARLLFFMPRYCHPGEHFLDIIVNSLTLTYTLSSWQFSLPG
jgi:hypothetical protein